MASVAMHAMPRDVISCHVMRAGMSVCLKTCIYAMYTRRGMACHRHVVQHSRACQGV